MRGLLMQLKQIWCDMELCAEIRHLQIVVSPVPYYAVDLNNLDFNNKKILTIWI